MQFTLPGFDLARFVRATLDEDLGVGLPGGGYDVTAQSVIPADARFSGVMDSRDPVTVAGLPIAAAFFRALDPDMRIEILAEEGTQVPGSTVPISSRPLVCALSANNSKVSSTLSRRLKFFSSKGSFPDSILEKSRMSLRMVSNDSALL